MAILAAIVLAIFFYIALRVNQPESEVLTDRVLKNTNYNFQLKAPEGWFFLKIPNSILNYPQSAAQLTNEDKSSFCVVIPEPIADPTIKLTLDTVRDVTVKTIKQENPNAKVLNEEKAKSTWSQRLRIEYVSSHGVNKVRWLVQLDLMKNIVFRTTCWCEQEAYPYNEAAFLEICNSLKPLQE